MSDTWRVSQGLTITSGLGYAYETPPGRKNGKASRPRVSGRDPSSIPPEYLAKAESGGSSPDQSTIRILGFETTGNLHKKYPYVPFKGGLAAYPIA